MVDMNRPKLIYERKDPSDRWVVNSVTHVAIQTQTTPNYVFGAYSLIPGVDKLPNLPNDLLVVSIDDAIQRYHLQKGKIADCKF